MYYTAEVGGQKFHVYFVRRDPGPPHYGIAEWVIKDDAGKEINSALTQEGCRAAIRRHLNAPEAEVTLTKG
jgi:hypothetical protein